VAHDQDVAGVVVRRLQLLQRGQNEDGGLTHAGLGLTEDVHAQYGLRNALVLNCKRRASLATVPFVTPGGVQVLTLRGMLEAAVYDGAQDLRFQEEIAEAGTVNGHIGALDILLGGLLVFDRSGLGLLLILVVQKIVIVGHFCGFLTFN